MSVELHVDPSSLEITASGATSGRIWMTLGEVAFPEEGWFDFPVVVTTLWLDLLSELLSGKVSRGQVRFMEGSFTVVAAIESDRLVRIEFQARRSVPIVFRSIEATSALSQAVGAAQALAEECEMRHWQSADIESLQRAIREARV
jgi:hypothetical protein